ncbi:Uncharacterised protein [Shewanella baltica]|nr:Uncharacterised protein [Shewanella baltica]
MRAKQRLNKSINYAPTAPIIEALIHSNFNPKLTN